VSWSLNPNHISLCSACQCSDKIPDFQGTYKSREKNGISDNSIKEVILQSSFQWSVESNSHFLCFFSLVHCVIVTKKYRHFLNQLQLKPKPIVTWSQAISLA